MRAAVAQAKPRSAGCPVSSHNAIALLSGFPGPTVTVTVSGTLVSGVSFSGSDPDLRIGRDGNAHDEEDSEGDGG
jgi:hypothetical protein